MAVVTLLYVIFQVIVAEASKKNEVIVCEGDEKVISCDNDETVIFVEDAYYGRRNASNCVDINSELTEVDCTSPKSLPIVWRLCQGRQSCVLAATNEAFHKDPCPFLRKYLSVTYRCEKEGVDIIGECPFEFWYPWIDGDSPTGTGDYETFYRHRLLLPNWCIHPSAVQIQRKDGRPYSLSNEVLKTGVPYGVSCTNSHQKGSSCSNYKIRFCCPSDCAADIRDQPMGEIQSPYHPLKYEPNTDCSWIIRTTYEKYISLHIVFMEIERQKECRYDYLEINDLNERSVVFRECKTLRNVTVDVSGNVAQVRFVSDPTNEFRGFLLEWKSLRIPACSKPDPPLYGGIATPHKLLWKAGTVVEYYCNDNFTMEGENIALCEDNEKWSEPRPLCKAICAQTPLEYFQRLPDYCTEPDGKAKFLNVGKCPENKCKSESMESPTCCGVRETEIRKVDCGTFTLPLAVALVCGCEECSENEISISGIAFGGNVSNPLQYGTISFNGGEVGRTDEFGNFALVLKRMDRKKITLGFVDNENGRLLNKIKVVEVDSEGRAILQVNMTMMPPPVTINSGEPSTVILKSGSPEGSDRHPYGQVHIVPNSVSDMDGNPYDGQVELAIHVVDNRDPSSWDEAPGAFEAESGEDSDVSLLLENYGMFQFHLNSPDNDPLEIKNMEIQVDASHVADERHLQNMRIWSFNDSKGQWDDEGFMTPFYDEGSSENKVFLIGNINVTVGRIWSLNVLIDEYCYAKVRTYASTEFDFRDQLGGVAVRAVYMSSSGSWLGYSSEVTEGGNGACVMVPCTGSPGSLRVIHFSASNAADEDLWAVSSNPFNSNAAGISEFLAELLNYRRSDHVSEEFQKTSFNLTINEKFDVSERWYGPIYASSQVERCFLAPPTDSHFRFYREQKSARSAMETEYSAVSSLSNISDPRYWGPTMDYNTACFVKVAVTGKQALIRATSSGGVHPLVKGQLYGYRQKFTTGEKDAVCIQFKCTKYLEDNGMERPLISVSSLTEGCEVADINHLLTNYLSSVKPSSGGIQASNSFQFLAPTSPLGSDFGIYVVTRPSQDDAIRAALHQCREGSSFRPFLGDINADEGVALNFLCGK